MQRSNCRAVSRRWVVEEAHKGRDVVRLKIGDPFLFGRGAEEILYYRQHGLEPFVVPGLHPPYRTMLIHAPES
jgi:uroporphyrin-III C-methyltransferase